MFDVSYIDSISNAYFNNASHVCIDGYHGNDGTVCLRKTTGIGVGYTMLATSTVLLLLVIIFACKKRWFNVLFKSPPLQHDEAMFLIDVEAEGFLDPQHNSTSRL
ncbi:unnamed protein product [Bursaphelenchus xylophilus]|uniref:(pine wood nematode) hypothetical protein n=1 Tax=Bursaphelenchus xylophilus TaxID=6326 RepID=A0A1I7SGF3_BURXY|nr:unnamed protein product [Bursaphelenchus xylophilus]CAG9125081.1 unnamed protein product [Bursaphelenchus xylophilus]